MQTTVKENQVEKTVENDMETGIKPYPIGILLLKTVFETKPTKLPQKTPMSTLNGP